MTPDHTEIERLITEVAEPLIRQIMARFFGARGALPYQDADDVAATVTVRLLHKLQRAGPGDDAIQNFEKYVARLTYNTINDQLRTRFPERTRHKNRVRYVLTHDARLALWSTSAGLAAGLKSWNGTNTALTSVPLDPARAPRVMLDRNRPADALKSLFDLTGRPVELEAVVEFTAGLWHVADVLPGEMSEAKDAQDPAPKQLERREFLVALWREIEQLRPMQRKALLLNLRDEETVNVISLLVLTGVAKFDDIAAALEMTPDGLAAIWNDLPLDDLRIGNLLNVTRQQVINLRKSARERLARRVR